MKTRLGLLIRFKVYRTLISQIFSNWVRATAKVLSCTIKVWDLDTVNTLKLKKIKSKKLHLLHMPLKYSFRHQKVTRCNT